MSLLPHRKVYISLHNLCFMDQRQDNIYTAQLQLAEAYFTKIRNYFPSLDHASRKSLLHSLDCLVENNSPETAERKKREFDYEDARQTREGQGLTRKQLSKKVGKHELTIYKYETGKLIPNEKTGKKYLEWLSQHHTPQE